MVSDKVVPFFCFSLFTAWKYYLSCLKLRFLRVLSWFPLQEMLPKSLTYCLSISLKSSLQSIWHIKSTLQDFGTFSRSKANIMKSVIFFYHVCGHKNDIVGLFGYHIGVLPIRYLGLPLSLKKLSYSMRIPLIEKIRAKIKGWKSSLLSYVNLLQLLKSILNGMSHHWASTFKLPKCVLKLIIKLFASLLWRGNFDTKGFYNVNWERICKPLSEGGLGLRDIFEVNKAWLDKTL